MLKRKLWLLKLWFCKSESKPILCEAKNYKEFKKPFEATQLSNNTDSVSKCEYKTGKSKQKSQNHVIHWKSQKKCACDLYSCVQRVWNPAENLEGEVGGGRTEAGLCGRQPPPWVRPSSSSSSCSGRDTQERSEVSLERAYRVFENDCTIFVNVAIGFKDYLSNISFYVPILLLFYLRYSLLCCSNDVGIFVVDFQVCLGANALFCFLFNFAPFSWSKWLLNND